MGCVCIHKCHGSYMHEGYHFFNTYLSTYLQYLNGDVPTNCISLAHYIEDKDINLKLFLLLLHMT